MARIAGQNAVATCSRRSLASTPTCCPAAAAPRRPAAAVPAAATTIASERMRVAVEKCLGETKNMPAEQAVAKMLRVLDEHVKLDELADNDPRAGAVREITGDDEDDVKAFLKSRGLSDADADEAWRLAQACLPVADRLPLDATRGGMGGYGHGSENDRVGRGPAMDEATRSRVASEMDVLLGTGRVSVGFRARASRAGRSRCLPRGPWPTSTRCSSTRNGSASER